MFEKKPTILKNSTCHSGGAKGADSIFESTSEIYGVKTNAYSYKTDYHITKNKVEITFSAFK